MRVKFARFKDAVYTCKSACQYLPTPRLADKIEVLFDFPIGIRVLEKETNKIIYIPLTNIIQLDIDDNEDTGSNIKKSRRRPKKS